MGGRLPTYLCLLSSFLSRTWGSRERVEKTTTRTASLTVPPPPPPLLHASYSRREAAVPRFDAPTWPNWKKPVSSSRSSFFACILAFCAASASTSLQLFLLFSVLHGRLFLLSLFLSLLFSLTLFSLFLFSLSFSSSFFFHLLLSASLPYALRGLLERVDAAWANPWEGLYDPP